MLITALQRAPGIGGTHRCKRESFATTRAPLARCRAHSRRADMRSAVVVVPDQGVTPAQLQGALAAAHGAACGRVYVCAPGCTADAACAHVLHSLSHLYGAAAAVDARLDAVPLLPFVGWDDAAVLALSDIDTLVRFGGGAAGRAAALEQALRQQRHVAVVDAPAPAAASVAADAPPPAPRLFDAAECALPRGGEEHRLAFDRVAVGGTFDRLHAGHRLLLAATALVAARHVYAGVTADALLANKANKALLEGYDARAAAAADFMAAVRPGLSVATGALCDPKAPTQAELDPAMQALVVSRETLAGGESINEARAARGFAPLRLVIVDLVGGSGAADKLSSTALRQRDAEALAAAAAAKGEGGSAG